MNESTKFGKIRIVRAPAGQAPLEIREKWVGVEMICLYHSNREQSTHHAEINPDPKAYEAFVVLQTHAICSLARSSPEAVSYWERNGFPTSEAATFMFDAQCAEVMAPPLECEVLLELN